MDRIVFLVTFCLLTTLTFTQSADYRRLNRFRFRPGWVRKLFPSTAESMNHLLYVWPPGSFSWHLTSPVKPLHFPFYLHQLSAADDPFPLSVADNLYSLSAADNPYSISAADNPYSISAANNPYLLTAADNLYSISGENCESSKGTGWAHNICHAGRLRLGNQLVLETV